MRPFNTTDCSWWWADREGVSRRDEQKVFDHRPVGLTTPVGEWLVFGWGLVPDRLGTRLVE